MRELFDAGNRMTIVHRDVRVTALELRTGHRHGSPGPTGLALRVSAMLAAIARRYARWQGRWPDLNPVLWHPWRGITLQPVVLRTQFHLAPHLRLTVLAQSRSEGMPSSGSTTRPWPAQERSTASRLVGQPPAAPSAHQPPEMVVGHLRTRRPVETAPVETMVNRLLRWGVRVETVGAPRTHMTQPEGTATVKALPVPRVVRWTTTDMAADNRPPVAETVSAPGSPRPTMAQVPGHGEPPLDLNRLTDQVVQAIDRRIIAQRERLGRV